MGFPGGSGREREELPAEMNRRGKVGELTGIAVPCVATISLNHLLCFDAGGVSLPDLLGCKMGEGFEPAFCLCLHRASFSGRP